MEINTELKGPTPSIRMMKLNRSLLIIFALAGLFPPTIFRFFNWYNGKPLPSVMGFTYSIFTSVITTVVISASVIYVINWLQEKHPWHRGILKRIFWEMLGTTLTACGLITVLVLIFHLFIPKRDLSQAIFDHLLIAFIMNAVLVAVSEGIYFFRQWKKSTLETERFKKESIRAQFESLKNQVNPHFLFNSLNTLSSMIDVDREQSKEFLDKLSQVYRYVLQHKDDEVVAVQDELEFIHAFTGLLKKRHGNRVSFHFNIDQESLTKGMAPMTLQLLVENAVKHNIASRKKPLTVEVFNDGNQLYVRNNLQPKRNVVSTGIGLENIKNRYRFLIEKEIQILKTESIFQVGVPLISFV